MQLTTQDSLLIGFFLGMLVGGWVSSRFVKGLINRGYAKFEVTEKFMKEMDKKDTV